MTYKNTQAPNGFVTVFISAALIMLMLRDASPAQTRPSSRTVEALKIKAHELHAKGDAVQIKLLDGTTVQGRILRVDDHSFTFRQKKPAQEVVMQYTGVTEIKKKGLGKKVVLIPAVVGGGALLVLCVAPYPIGFLCRKDPS
jgi:hypothetical protein